MSEVLLSVKELSVELHRDEGVYKVLDSISFDLKKGETLGVVGESGCGKSMLANAIMGLLNPPLKLSEGSVVFEGEDIAGISEKKYREIRGKRIAMIFQDPMTSLNPLIKCGVQISETILAHEKITKAKAKERAIELIGQVGLENPELVYNKIPGELSGGQRQRIVIAMALSCNPDLIICDEPTTALDVVIQKQILNLIKDLIKETGASCIFISHDMGVVSNMADRVMIMYAGEVVEIAETQKAFRLPYHPYTKGLKDSLPQSTPQGEKLNEIRGTVPMLGDLPKGCLFAPRCDKATKECLLNRPELVEMDGRKVRCINHLRVCQ